VVGGAQSSARALPLSTASLTIFEIRQQAEIRNTHRTTISFQNKLRMFTI